MAGTTTLTLPASSSTLATTADVAASTPDALSTASGSAPSYSARAWVNFNGTGTVAIRDSGNVSSITDNAVGKYTINLTTAMSDINYSVTANASIDSIGRAVKITVFTTGTAISVPTTSSFLINATSDSNVSYDASYVTVSVFR